MDCEDVSADDYSHGASNSFESNYYEPNASYVNIQFAQNPNEYTDDEFKGHEDEVDDDDEESHTFLSDDVQENRRLRDMGERARKVTHRNGSHRGRRQASVPSSQVSTSTRVSRISLAADHYPVKRSHSASTESSLYGESLFGSSAPPSRTLSRSSSQSSNVFPQSRGNSSQVAFLALKQENAALRRERFDYEKKCEKLQGALDQLQ